MRWDRGAAIYSFPRFSSERPERIRSSTPRLRRSASTAVTPHLDARQFSPLDHGTGGSLGDLQRRGGFLDRYELILRHGQGPGTPVYAVARAYHLSPILAGWLTRPWQLMQPVDAVGGTRIARRRTQRAAPCCGQARRRERWTISRGTLGHGACSVGCHTPGPDRVPRSLNRRSSYKPAGTYPSQGTPAGSPEYRTQPARDGGGVRECAGARVPTERASNRTAPPGLPAARRHMSRLNGRA